MEGEARVECYRILEIIDRLGRCEEITDEETAQVILHTSNCITCKTHVDNVLNKARRTDGHSLDK